MMRKARDYSPGMWKNPFQLRTVQTLSMPCAPIYDILPTNCNRDRCDIDQL